MSRIEKVEEELRAKATNELIQILGEKWSVFANTNIGTWDFHCDNKLVASGESELQALKRGLMWVREQYQQVEYEIVDHPQHYGGAEAKHEAISVIEEWNLGFHLGNVVKYISRAGKKPDQTTISDLQKARWYLDRYIENLECQYDTNSKNGVGNN